MNALRLDATEIQSPSCCGHVGGQPHLPAASVWPRCRLCATDMVAFIEVVLRSFESSPFAVGSRLQIFACREHDDIPGTIYSDYTPFQTASRTRTLPQEYWKISDGHYLIRLLPPDEKTVASGSESRLVTRFLTAIEAESHPADSMEMPVNLQLFGEPFWQQDPEDHECCCGTAMALLIQFPDGYEFPMAAGAPEQPNSFSPTDYCLFLGNQVSLFACTKQCHPQAIWPILQS